MKNKVSWLEMNAPYLVYRYSNPVGWLLIISVIAFVFPTEPINNFLFGSYSTTIYDWYANRFFDSYQWGRFLTGGYSRLTQGVYFYLVAGVFILCAYRFIVDLPQIDRSRKAVKNFNSFVGNDHK